jgi:hypothetical protein
MEHSAIRLSHYGFKVALGNFDEPGEQNMGLLKQILLLRPYQIKVEVHFCRALQETSNTRESREFKG